MERVAELVRLGRLVPLPAPPATIEAVPAERVLAKPREEVVEHLLADPPRPPRGQLQAAAVARQVPGLLEPAREVVERVEVAHGVVAEQLADVAPVDRGQVARGADVTQLVLQRVERLEPAELLERTLQPERLVALEPVAVAEAVGQQRVHVRGELGEVPAQPVVPEQGVGHRLELGPLLGRHRAQQRLHRGHPLGELLDDVVEGARTREEPAVLRQELRGVRVAARHPLAQQLVEVADHLAVRGEVLRRDALDRLRQAGDVLVEHLALQPLDQLVEAFPRRGLEEVVVLQAADPGADVGWQAVEVVEPLGGDVAQHGAQRRVLLRGLVRRRARRRASSEAASSRRSIPARSSATISSSSARMSPSTSPSW